MRREQEEAEATDPATPLTGQNGHTGQAGAGRGAESHPLVSLRPAPSLVQSDQQQQARPSKLTMNGIVQRLRNKSGSTGGEA